MKSKVSEQGDTLGKTEMGKTATAAFTTATKTTATAGPNSSLPEASTAASTLRTASAVAESEKRRVQS